MATPKDLPRDIGGFIRDLRHNAKISLRQLAEQTGVSNPYLSQIERGLRKPSAEVLQQIASALRVSTPAMYLRAGLLDDKEGQGVLAAIATDPDLTMPQKQSLSQIYETFRRENARHAAADAEAEADAEPQAEPAAPAPAAPAPATPAPAAGGGPAVSPTDAVLESVSVTEAGAAPAPAAGPGSEHEPAQKKTARKVIRRSGPRARQAAAAAEEEES